MRKYICRRRTRNPRLSGNDSEGVSDADPNGSDLAQGSNPTASSSGPVENSSQESSPPGDKLEGETTMLAGIRSTPKVMDYTVGWICALPLEMSAAMATFDKFHTKLTQRPTDHNTYALSQIGDHNVVVACLGAGVVGSASAAVVAAQMLFTFPSLKFCLMVGVGGGAPSRRHDIRLGDVVVSNPEGNYGGVVQYDFGKTVAGGGKFESAKSLKKPPDVLLKAVTGLSARHGLEGNKVAQYMEEMLERYPLLREKSTYQGAEHDRLFEAAYGHQGGDDDCSGCDPQRLVSRPARSTPLPAIHYGLIASAN